jgi:hypothetical protein
MLRRLVFQQVGMSLVQGMLIAAVLAGSSLVMTKLLQDQKKSIKGAETRDAIERLHDLIVSTLQDRTNCFQTLAAPAPQGHGLTNPTQNTTQALNFVSAFSHNSANTVVARVYDGTTNTAYMNQAVSVRAIRLRTPLLFDATNQDGVGAIEIDYQRLSVGQRTGDGVGVKNITKRIPLQFQRNRLGVFIGCYALQDIRAADNSFLGGVTQANQDLNEEFCLQMGKDASGASLFQYNAQTKTCEIKNFRCPYARIFSGIESTGEPRCEDLKDWVNMSHFVNLSHTENCLNSTQVRLIKMTGENRVQIQCSGSSVCVPSPDCATAIANTPCGNPASNNCGPCGTGTMGCSTLTCYRDADNDDYGNPSSSITTSLATCADYSLSVGSKWVANNTDCCDSDNRARPNQTAYFQTPRTGCGGYDFNCRDGEERQIVYVNFSGGYTNYDEGWGSCVDTTQHTGYFGSDASSTCGAPITWPSMTEECTAWITEGPSSLGCWSPPGTMVCQAGSQRPFNQWDYPSNVPCR